MELYGRRRIYTDVDNITADNVEDVLRDALLIHEENAREIRYLHKYVRGQQPILEREKLAQEEINNKIVRNSAAIVLHHKMGYIFGHPINYVRSEKAEKEGSGDVPALNLLLDEQKKDAFDQKLAYDFLVCGLGYRGVLPNPDEMDESPFTLVELPAETTFCIYKNDVFRRKLAGVSYVVRADQTVVYTVYTDKDRFELIGTGPYGLALSNTSTNGVGCIPILEYRMPGNAPLGAFELAVPLCDAVNNMESCRADSVQQFVNAILWMNNVNLDEEALSRLRERFGLLTSSDPGTDVSVSYITAELNQDATQSLVDDLYESILELCAVPSVEAQSSGGSTGSAMELSNGWRKAEDDAKRIETAFKEGERDAIKVILSILSRSKKTPKGLQSLRPADIDIKFNRNKTANILTKSQGAMNMKELGIHPQIIIRECDLFSDPEQVYQDSLEYIEKAYADKQEAIPVNNRPRSDQSLQNNVASKATAQKRD